MDEYIEREKAVNAVRNVYLGVQGVQAINRIKAADVAPVRHGRWIDTYPDIDPNPMFMYGICSECRFEQGISKYLNYCPNCGARMDLEDDDNA